MTNQEVLEQIKSAASLAEGLTEHFSYLADTPGFDKVLAEIMKRAESVESCGKGKIAVSFPNNMVMTCRKAADASSKKYQSYPASFRALAAVHKAISFPNDGWAICFEKLSAEDTDLEQSDAPEDTLELLHNPKTTIPFIDYSDWWIYHPEERNPQGEPVLCLLSHETCEIEERVQYNAGSLLLRRMAETLDIDVEIPAVAPMLAQSEGEQLADIQTWWGGLDPLLREEIESSMKLVEGLDCTLFNLLRLTEKRDFLYLSGRSCSDVEPLSELTSVAGIERFSKLCRIEITDTKVTDFSPIYGLANLETITIGGNGNTSYKWLKNLKGLKKLRSMTFFRLTESHTLEGLENLSQLVSLTTYGSTFSDISAVAGLINLNALTLENTSVSSLEPIEKLVNLSHLNIEGTKVRSLKPVENLAELTDLFSGRTHVSSLEPLKGLKRLRGLYLTDTDVESLEPLAQLENLDTLYLIGTKVNSLEPLKGLKRLKTLRLDGTGISSLEPLRQLENLETLTFSNTKVSSIDPTEFLAEIEKTRKIAAAKQQFIDKLVYAMQNDSVTRDQRNAAFHRLLAEDLAGLETFLTEESDKQYSYFINHFWAVALEKRYEEAAEMVIRIMSMPLIDARKQMVLNIGVYVAGMPGNSELEAVCLGNIPDDDRICNDRLAYNLACYFAVKGDKAGLLRYARLAIALKNATGQTGVREMIMKDGDFATFRDDPDFLALINELPEETS